MMKKTRHTNPLRMIALLGVVLTAVILFAGCGKAPQGEKTSAREVATKTPAKTVIPVKTPEKQAVKTTTTEAPAAAQGILAKIKAVDDFVKLYALQQENEQGGKQSDPAGQAFADKWETLTKGMIPRTLTTGLDFLAVSTKATGDKEYTFSFLFRATADLKTNYHLNVYGTVCAYNAKYLQENQREDLYVQWNCYLTNEPTSQWKVGEYRVVQLKVDTELIPYSLRLDLVTRDEQLKWTGLVSLLYLGWQWDVRDEKSFLSKVEACSDFATLHALAPTGPQMSALVAQAVERKWKTLTANLEPQTMIDGLDFLAIHTKATGEKEYTFSFLLRPTADLDTDYHLSITGKVDPSFRQYIKPTTPGGSFTTWALPLYSDPMSQWKAGEYHVAQLRVETKTIPFDMSVILQARDAQGNWTGNPGNRIALGWQADVSEQAQHGLAASKSERTRRKSAKTR